MSCYLPCKDRLGGGNEHVCCVTMVTWDFFFFFFFFFFEDSKPLRGRRKLILKHFCIFNVELILNELNYKSCILRVSDPAFQF